MEAGHEGIGYIRKCVRVVTVSEDGHKKSDRLGICGDIVHCFPGWCLLRLLSWWTLNQSQDSCPAPERPERNRFSMSRCHQSFLVAVVYVTYWDILFCEAVPFHGDFFFPFKSQTVLTCLHLPFRILFTCRYTIEQSGCKPCLLFWTATLSFFVPSNLSLLRFFPGCAPDLQPLRSCLVLSFFRNLLTTPLCFLFGFQNLSVKYRTKTKAKASWEFG